MVRVIASPTDSSLLRPNFVWQFTGHEGTPRERALNETAMGKNGAKMKKLVKHRCSTRVPGLVNFGLQTPEITRHIIVFFFEI